MQFALVLQTCQGVLEHHPHAVIARSMSFQKGLICSRRRSNRVHGGLPAPDCFVGVDVMGCN
jgi:hypothetical protein